MAERKCKATSKVTRPESKASVRSSPAPSKFPSRQKSSPAQAPKRERMPQASAQPSGTDETITTRPIKTSDFAAQYGGLSKKRRQKMLDQFGALIVRPDLTQGLSEAPKPPLFDPHAAALRTKCMRKAQQWIHDQPAQRPATRTKLENAIKCVCFTNANLMTVPFLLARLFSEGYLAIDLNGYFVFPLLDAKRKEFYPIDRFDLPAFALDLHEMQVRSFSFSRVSCLSFWPLTKRSASCAASWSRLGTCRPSRNHSLSSAQLESCSAPRTL